MPRSVGPWTTLCVAHRLYWFFKTEKFKNWWQSMAVGNCLQLSTGSGWDVLQRRRWSGSEPA
jgi:hypothetical protein